ncbi:Ribosomal RNA large subunit methyltransferase L [Roseivivax sp. THAF40]|uniref:THUMP domain-containing class I SAM-dependent RNA methyltransferase n=1 Tax=unclassified Roseivivax TaxID=2639302 RepID=UPI001268D069|nr:MULTISPECIES: class I SAM-dependent RNA methyltransferase [unclassified Roseivivax]QFS84385.1 Ribosomal RNA large subunit methyltransferase L [Roseivivax sp. THAF197b]QFT48213.1 Ribosomal RNA large subunit methyltransferase L [Roseivivax sp. THAF40]
MADPLDIFLITAPGLEHFLGEEARAAGFVVTQIIPGGVSLKGGWDEVWRANLELRGATRVLVRLAAFHAHHLSQLDKRARKLPWSDWLRADVPVRVEATSRKSKIYHAGAAKERIEKALAAALGAPISDDAPVTIKLRVEDDLCTLSVDTSGASLHKRGLKEQVNKAPMRETLASLFLRAAGFDGAEPVVDPMCGSGTFVIEAAERAAGLMPGRARSFAFEHLTSFDPAGWEAARSARTTMAPPAARFAGSDRDQGAIAMSRANALRADVAEHCDFACHPVTEARPPDGAPGLVIVNPPYGLRIGAKSPLFGLYAAFGARMQAAFPGWRVAMITSEAKLARAAGLPWRKPGPIVDHGGTKVRLWQTGPL